MKIYDKGRVVVRPPFQIEDEVYTLVSNSTITGLLDMGIDIYTKVYKPAGYTENQFNKVVIEEPVISILRTDAGTVKYVPSNHLMASDTSYIPYKEVGVLINLGPLETNLDFTKLKDSLSKAVQHRMGTNPAISLETISDTIAVTDNEHALLKEQRLGVINSGTSIEAQLIKAEDHNILLRAQVNALLEFIQYYLKSCCGKDVCFDNEGQFHKVYYKHPLNWYVLLEHTNDEYGSQGGGGHLFTGETNAFQSYLRRWNQPLTV